MPAIVGIDKVITLAHLSQFRPSWYPSWTYLIRLLFTRIATASCRGPLTGAARAQAASGLQPRRVIIARFITLELWTMELLLTHLGAASHLSL